MPSNANSLMQAVKANDVAQVRQLIAAGRRRERCRFRLVTFR